MIVNLCDYTVVVMMVIRHIASPRFTPMSEGSTRKGLDHQ
jgi:hypothetical protein